jgi:hypothetical protein
MSAPSLRRSPRGKKCDQGVSTGRSRSYRLGRCRRHVVSRLVGTAVFERLTLQRKPGNDPGFSIFNRVQRKQKLA